ncbi:MAG: hypothetical protein GX557_00845, partial [Chloroflexi bacterium]|nr:hypothetical protein [Chloroflexota bacterium]
MRRNPERIAWLVLLSAFATLCVLVVAVPLGVRYHIAHAEESVRATVESLSGTIVVEQPVGAGPTPLSKGQNAVVREGTTIRVDETSEAFVTVLDHTLHLYPSTTLTLDRVRAPRYAASTEAVSVHVTVQGGRVDIGTALAPEHPLDFVVSTLQAESRLAADGSYALDVSNDLCETTVYRGHADVSARGATAALGPGERTEVLLGEPPQPATGVARQLLANSDLSEPLSDRWRVYNNQGNDGGAVDGRVEVVVEEGRQAARLVRTGGDGNHCETVLEQQIDRQLPDPATSLTVRATIKLKHQSLSGGGYLGFEYPLMIRITYRDVYDSEAEWVRGFYYQNVDGFPTNQGVELPRDRWY